MKTAKWFALPLAAALVFAGGLGGTLVSVAAEGPTAEQKKGYFHDKDLVDTQFVEEYAVLPKRAGVTIIDSRPTGRKYDKGHIPTAVSLPWSKWDKMAADVLPEDKNELLIFYCGGYHCLLSHKSAFAAEKMGYTNVKVYPAGNPTWKKNGNMLAVSQAYIQKQMDKGANMMVIDSRPKKRKYDKGHIPGAISIPDRKFEEHAHKLPEDKSTQLVFYCGGYICKLSENSAIKAKALGYTNVVTFVEGMPAWKKSGAPVAVGPEPGGAGAVAAAIKEGEDGAIDLDAFRKIVEEDPTSVLLVDVRDPAEYAAGTFKTAINIPVDQLEGRLDELPADKPIVFFCSAGGRGGEAYDLANLLRPELKTYFIDGQLSFNPDGTYNLQGPA
jgi:rhodanese-related sulfurtransferase